MSLAKVAIAALVAAAALPAHAAILYSNDFNSENGGVPQLNYTGLPINLGGGSIDLVADNTFGIRCAGNTGLCIDLDGTSGNAADITTDGILLEAGDYIARFDMSGNQRGGASDTVTFTVNDLINEVLTFDAGDPFQSFSYAFNLISDTLVVFGMNTAGGDNIGPIIDNVSLERVEPTHVPEPATLGLFGLGLLGIAAGRRRKAE